MQVGDDDQSSQPGERDGVGQQPIDAGQQTAERCLPPVPTAPVPKRQGRSVHRGVASRRAAESAHGDKGDFRGDDRGPADQLHAATVDDTCGVVIGIGGRQPT